MNVLFVMSDQHHAACIGAEGHPQAVTPNIDSLSSEGVRFRNAYCQNPICTPSRMSILSGQYCHNHNYYGLGGQTPSCLPSFLGHFRKHGYRTAAIGKLHIPNDPTDWLAEDCDVLTDCYFKPGGVEDGTSPYFDYLEKLGLREKEDSILLPEFPGQFQNEGRPSLLSFEHSVEGWCVSETTKFIDSCGDTPWCMQVSFNRPHLCYTPAREFWDVYPDDLSLPETIYNDASHRPPHFQQEVEKLKNWKWLIEPKTFEDGCRRVWHGYLGCITHVDHALGLLMQYLENKGIADNTIIIYTSDHGTYTGMFGVREKGPGICSEAVCRVPMIWRVPGLTDSGHVCEQLIEQVDFASTLPSLCGIDPMLTTDGCDITDLLAGKDHSVRDIAVTENVWSKAVRWGPWRFVHYQPGTFGTEDIGELYNLTGDPNETHNLYNDSQYQPIVEKSRRLLLEWFIGSQRPATVWPRLKETDPKLAEDNKEPNTAGVPLRVSRGAINYI